MGPWCPLAENCGECGSLSWDSVWASPYAESFIIDKALKLDQYLASNYPEGVYDAKPLFEEATVFFCSTVC
jgi:hypothetical protein